MKTNPNVSLRQPLRLLVAAGATWILLAATAGRVLAASAPTPPDAPDAILDAAWSAQGQQLLAATVALLVAMC